MTSNSFFFLFSPLLNLQLHLGVNGGAHKFAIERQAVNEASFRCPDELGWQPQVIIHHYLLRVSFIFCLQLELNCEEDGLASFLGYAFTRASKFLTNYKLALSPQFNSIIPMRIHTIFYRFHSSSEIFFTRTFHMIIPFLSFLIYIYSR